MDSQTLYDRLVRVVGAAHVSVTRAADLPATGPSVVIWPADADEVAAVLQICSAANVSLKVCGGGTEGGSTVAGDLLILDTRRMTNIIEVDELSLLVRAQAGVRMSVLEGALRRQGLTLGRPGRWPEDSTLGGQLARANATTGSVNSRRLALQCVAVSAVSNEGALMQTEPIPRRATGPGFVDLLLGTEGKLGPIVDATLVIYRLPEVERPLLATFPALSAAFAAMRSVLALGLRPTLLRVLGGRLAQEILPTVRQPQIVTGIVLWGPQMLVECQTAMIRRIADQQGTGLMPEETAERWWHDFESTELVANGAWRLPYSQSALLDQLTEDEKRHARICIDDFDLQGARLWVSDRETLSIAGESKSGLPSGHRPPPVLGQRLDTSDDTERLINAFACPPPQSPGERN